MNGFEFVKRIDELLSRTEKKQIDFLRDMDLQKSTIHNWKTRGNLPPADVAYKIAEYFGVDLVWLLTGKEDQFTNEEIELVNKYNSLTQEQKFSIDSLLQAYQKQNNNELKKSSGL